MRFPHYGVKKFTSHSLPGLAAGVVAVGGAGTSGFVGAGREKSHAPAAIADARTSAAGRFDFGAGGAGGAGGITTTGGG